MSSPHHSGSIKGEKTNTVSFDKIAQRLGNLRPMPDGLDMMEKSIVPSRERFVAFRGGKCPRRRNSRLVMRASENEKVAKRRINWLLFIIE